jgi:hypothetical protein
VWSTSHSGRLMLGNVVVYNMGLSVVHIRSTVAPRFDHPSNQRTALSTSKQHWSTVMSLTGPLPVALLASESPADKQCLDILLCPLVMTNVLLYASTSGVQMKSWKQRRILAP